MTRAAIGDRSGFTLIEVLIAMGVLTIALVAIAGMFPTGYRQVTDAGRMTLAVTAARQALEDIHTLPFASLNNLNGFDSSNVGTLAPMPANSPERNLARSWRYAVAGEGDGFNFTQAEIDSWPNTSPFGGQMAVQVQPGPGTSLQVTVAVSVPALPQNVTLTTLIVDVGI